MSNDFINTILAYREYVYAENELGSEDSRCKEYELETKDSNYEMFLEFLNRDDIKLENFDVANFKVISYFNDDEIIEHLTSSIVAFKQKYKYATTKQFFEKDYRFKTLLKNIKDISFFISEAVPTFFSHGVSECIYYGEWKNYLVYYYKEQIFFFDNKYISSTTIEIHFKHIYKLLNRNIKYLKKNNKEFYEESPDKDIEEKIQNRLSLPLKIKILDKLNFRGSMNEKHKFTDFQIIELLTDILECSEKTIRNNSNSNTHGSAAEAYISDLKNKKAKR